MYAESPLVDPRALLTRRLVAVAATAYSLLVSAFLIHQEPRYAVMLADSLGTKGAGAAATRVPLAAPKLVHVAPCAYAAHAGTWQPALEMLSRLRPLLLPHTDKGSPPDWVALSAQMSEIGRQVYAEFQKKFQLESFDVRVALLLTGPLRHSEDVASGCSSTLAVWEAAGAFEVQRVAGALHFGGSPALSGLATTILRNEFVRDTMKQSPLACAQALLAAHAALSKLSTAISAEANIVVCGEGEEHAVIQGTLLSLPNSALLRG